MIKQFLMRLAPIALVALPLAACGSTDSDSTTEHGEGEKAPEGPHGGRLLTDGPLGLEVTIFENGQEPQFRIYPYWEGEPLDPGTVNLQINLSRLGGEVDRRSEEHTSELQSLMRSSYAVSCLQNKTHRSYCSQFK